MLQKISFVSSFGFSNDEKISWLFQANYFAARRGAKKAHSPATQLM